MLLTGKVTVIFGGSGAIDSAVAQAMAHEEAHVCLGARSQERLNRTTSIIRTAGSTVETFTTDVLDEHSASKGVTRLIEQTGGVDVMVNTTRSIREQGKRISALSLSEFMSGITPFLSTQFNIAKAVTPHMGSNRAGVTLSVVAPVAPIMMPGYLGHIVDCAGAEAFIKASASEAGSVNIRAVSVRSHMIMDAVVASSHAGEIFSIKVQSIGLTVNQWLGGAAQGTMLAHLPTFTQIAEVMAFLASGHASAMTTTVVSITGGVAHS